VVPQKSVSIELLKDSVFDLGEAADFSGLSRTALDGLTACGRLQYVKVGRARRIPKAALTALPAESLVPSVADQAEATT
jgi:excisionase family DNA binding protein